MLYGLFLAGTIWFWILLAAAALLVALFVAGERFGKATFSIALTFAALHFFGDFNVLSWLAGHWLLSFACLAAYLAAGVGWSIGKWWLFVRAKRAKIEVLKAQFLIQRQLGGSTVPARLETEWHGWLVSNGAYEGGHVRGVAHPTKPPQVGQYKGRIMAWMVYWPWSFVTTIINDPIRKLFNGLFAAFQGLFQRISDHAFRESRWDVEVSPAPVSTTDAPSHEVDASQGP